MNSTSFMYVGSPFRNVAVLLYRAADTCIISLLLCMLPVPSGVLATLDFECGPPLTAAKAGVD